MRTATPEGSFLWIVNNIYFQYYSLVIFLISVAVMIGVSYATEKPDESKIRDLTFGTTTEEHRVESRRSWTKWDVVNSLIVIALILIAYTYFTG